MRVLVLLLCTCASAIRMNDQVVPGDRFCDKGTKATHEDDWYCCPQQCGGQCMNDQDECDEVKKHNGDTYNPSCCIPSFKDNGKDCKANGVAAPCKMEKQWNVEQKTAFRLEQATKATEQDTKKFDKVRNRVEAKNGPIKAQKEMAYSKIEGDDRNGYQALYKGSKPWTSTDDDKMAMFSDAMSGCDKLWNNDIRKACVYADNMEPGIYSLHKDHGLDSKRKLGNNAVADYFFGYATSDKANKFMNCVATEAGKMQVCKTTKAEDTSAPCNQCKKFKA